MRIVSICISPARAPNAGSARRTRRPSQVRPVDRARRPAAHPSDSTAVAQAGGQTVDGQVNGAPRPLVGLPRTYAAKQLNLQVVERIQVGKAIAETARKR